MVYENKYLENLRTKLSVLYFLTKRVLLLPISIRRLPAFIIIGGQKCGTAFLWEHLKKHPQIKMSKRIRFKKGSYRVTRELDYFNQNKSSVSSNEYRKYFHESIWSATISKFRRKIIWGEKTPSYISVGFVPKNIKSVVPNAKFIALLRNPIDRIYSHYLMDMDNKIINSSFQDVVDESMKTLEKHGINYSNINSNLIENAGLARDYLVRGMYAFQLDNWYRYFPKEQIMVIKSEGMFVNPEETLLGIHKYLDVQSISYKQYINSKARDYPEMSSWMREKLELFYAPYNRDLYELLGREFDW